MLTAKELTLTSCHACLQLVKNSTTADNLCPRCGSSLHLRKPNSITRTWALLLAALIFYIPANLLPVMTVTRFGQGEPDTIMSGVQHLYEGGMWHLALLIFIASVVVPLFKIIILIYLLTSVQNNSTERLLDKTKLYRMTEIVGPWSMVDIYIVAILVALVQFGKLITISPGLGASFFALVVICTVLSANSFDPRLIWDKDRSK